MPPALVQLLNDESLPYHDPLGKLNWEGVARDTWWLPPESLSLAGVPAFERLPIVDRLIPVIADDYVVVPDADSDDPKARYASGFLKVTPAHDPNDWEIGQRHGLAIVNVMAPDASMPITSSICC